MNDTSQYNKEAKGLVDELRKKGIRDERILEAVGKIPRHSFVDKSLSESAYADRALPIDKGQTISQPYTVAFQTSLLQLIPDDKVLEIGTGSGYQAAVLCEMGANVYSIERHHLLYAKAKSLLDSLGYKARLFYGDGYEGLPDEAPFDKILITAATSKFPEKLLQQLRIGGIMAAPIGNDDRQTMTVVRRIEENKYKETRHGYFIFVPMIDGLAK